MRWVRSNLPRAARGLAGSGDEESARHGLMATGGLAPGTGKGGRGPGLTLDLGQVVWIQYGAVWWLGRGLRIILAQGNLVAVRLPEDELLRRKVVHLLSETFEMDAQISWLET